MKKWGVIVAMLLLFVAARTYFSVSHRWQTQATIKTGDALVQAIEAYKADHAEYPSDLQSLRPKYIAEIQPPTLGTRSWKYHRVKTGAFELGVPDGASGYPVFFYDSATKTWDWDR